MSDLLMSTQELACKINENQYVLLDVDNSRLTLEEYKSLEMVINKVSYEDVLAGDAGDQHSLKVGRFRRDIEYPVDLSPLSESILKIINNQKMQNFYQEITGFDKVCIRRIQSNILNPGNYVGLHIDGVGDPKFQGTHIDYQFAVVLHFSSEYEGGDTVLLSPSGKVQLKLPAYSMLIITGALPHEVQTVFSGQRRTLVYFLSSNFGKSK